jgi:hypothetical protein
MLISSRLEKLLECFIYSIRWWLKIQEGEITEEEEVDVVAW